MEVYTVKQVAERYGVSKRMVYLWIQKGLLGHFRLGGNGEYRIRDIDLAKFEER